MKPVNSSMSTFCMLYAAMLDHVSLPAKLPFEEEEVGDLPKSSSSHKNGNGELLVFSIRAIKQPLECVFMAAS